LARRPPELIELGRVAGSYGVRGWVKVAPQRGVAEALVAAKEWWLGDKAWRVDEARVHSATVVARLGGVETREQALALKGRRIAVARSALPNADDGRYYLADLVGLEVVNAQGQKLGVVRQWFSNGPQDVMELDGGDRVRLVPWVPSVVRKVDLAAKRVEVDWQADW
jgi:16S rRNA processing protein RimM